MRLYFRTRLIDAGGGRKYGRSRDYAGFTAVLPRQQVRRRPLVLANVAFRVLTRLTCSVARFLPPPAGSWHRSLEPLAGSEQASWMVRADTRGLAQPDPTAASGDKSGAAGGRGGGGGSELIRLQVFALVWRCRHVGSKHVAPVCSSTVILDISKLPTWRRPRPMVDGSQYLPTAPSVGGKGGLGGGGCGLW